MRLSIRSTCVLVSLVCVIGPGRDALARELWMRACERGHAALAVEPSVKAQAKRLEAAGASAMNEHRYADAVEAYSAWRELEPTNFVAAYNQASALAMAGDLGDAERALTDAIARGFDDVFQLRRDEHLVPLRGRQHLRDLVRGWSEILEARRQANLARDLAWVREGRVDGKPIRRTLDDDRVEVISAYDDTSTGAALADLERVAQFCAEQRLFNSYDDAQHNPWVVLALPETRDFQAWARGTFGSAGRGAGATVGGAYDHNLKRLVARDLGPTLRHEFVHVLHWRAMIRSGHAEPLWVQEGIASLIETYDVEGGRVVPRADWRTNIVGRLARARRLPRLADVAAMDFQRFGSSRPLANYAIARAVFLWLYQKDRLDDFRGHYDETMGEDPSGLTAVARSLGIERERLDAEFRSWTLSLPVVAETGSDLVATLGVDVEIGPGDGLKVVGLSPEARRRTGLRLGSVLTAIDGRPTGDMNELIRVLSTYRAGESVTLHHRRGTVHTTSQARLIERD